MISSCCSVVTVLFTRLSIFQNFYTSSLCFLFLVPHWRKEGQNPWDSFSVQHERNLEYTRRHYGSLSVFFVKVPPKNDFQSITEEPKYQAKALTVVTDTIKKNWLTAGAAVVVTIPSVELYTNLLLKYQQVLDYSLGNLLVKEIFVSQ